MPTIREMFERKEELAKQTGLLEEILSTVFDKKNRYVERYGQLAVDEIVTSIDAQLLEPKKVELEKIESTEVNGGKRKKGTPARKPRAKSKKS